MLAATRIAALKRRVEHKLPADAIARRFAVFADATRLRIIRALTFEHELCVTDLAKVIGLSPPTISHHLRQMKDMGVVADTRMGQEVCYTLIESEFTKFAKQLLA